MVPNTKRSRGSVAENGKGGISMGNLRIYTADDEEPDCNRCDHCCDDFLCVKQCGAEHGWRGYERIEIEESEENQ